MQVLSSPVVSMQLHHPLLQLSSLVGGEAEVADVVGAVLVMVVVTQLRLHRVGAQQRVCDEGAGEPAREDVIPQLQTQVISVQREKV